MTGVLVQRMLTAGAEMIVGALHDPLIGWLIACGTGGVLVDVLADSDVPSASADRVRCGRDDR